MRSVGIKLAQFHHIRVVVLVLRIGVAKDIGHTRKMEASKATARRVSDPSVLRIGAVEPDSCGIRGHEAARLRVDPHTALATASVVVELVDDEDKSCEVELEEVVLFNAIFKVVGASRNVVSHVARHSRVRGAVHCEGAEKAVLHEAVFEEGLPIHPAHDVEVEGVPAHFVLLAHPIGHGPSDAALGPRHAHDMAAVTSVFAGRISLEGDRPRK
mmetsp:Transcript_130444/g.309473  ORF Transcript_130444/g.309473 Transcript_130444/m.309473 type:complete len:214 (-) Transcript_130444:909-1550(-)